MTTQFTNMQFKGNGVSVINHFQFHYGALIFKIPSCDNIYFWTMLTRYWYKLNTAHAPLCSNGTESS